MSLTVERPFHVSAVDQGRKAVIASLKPKPIQSSGRTGRVPRITRLMALAIKLDGYVREGIVTDYAELARLGHVSRARVTQIMDLNLLAPDIQQAILELSETLKGRDSIRERHLRQIVCTCLWSEQRAAWQSLRPAGVHNSPT